MRSAVTIAGHLSFIDYGAGSPTALLVSMTPNHSLETIVVSGGQSTLPPSATFLHSASASTSRNRALKCRKNAG